jgi:nucleoside-diphosphate-sugar epimerase
MDQNAVATKIFITGSAGCIGHYLLDRFLGREGIELHLLVRSSSKFKVDLSLYSNVTVHRGDLAEIGQFKEVLQDMDYLIHIATSWRNSDKAFLYNVTSTYELFGLMNRDRCKKIVYFSTASILGPGNVPLDDIHEIGTGYIRSKAAAYDGLPQHPMADKVVTVFPTMVLGGDETHPFSHISGGLAPNIGYMKLLRFFTVDIRFHFLHAKDYALMTEYVLFNETDHAVVLGSPVITGKQMLETVCDVFGIRRYFMVPISGAFILGLAKLFRIKMDKWSRYLVANPHFEFNVINPQSVGLKASFPDLRAALEDVKQQARFFKGES